MPPKPVKRRKGNDVPPKHRLTDGSLERGGLAFTDLASPGDGCFNSKSSGNERNNCNVSGVLMQPEP